MIISNTVTSKVKALGEEMLFDCDGDDNMDFGVG